MEQIHVLVRDIRLGDNPVPGDNDILQTSEGVAGMGLAKIVIQDVGRPGIIFLIKLLI